MEYIVSGHGLTLNQESILVPGATQDGDYVSESANSIYTYGSCGQNMTFSKEPFIVNNLNQFSSHTFVYHDSEIMLCSYFLGKSSSLSCKINKNNNILNITPSGLYKLNVYRPKIKLNESNIIYSYTRSNPNEPFYISLSDALKLYEGAIYPTAETIAQIFSDSERLADGRIRFKHFIESPRINMKMSDLVGHIPITHPYKLYVLACRGFDDCVSISDKQQHLNSSGDSASSTENSPDTEVIVQNPVAPTKSKKSKKSKRKARVFGNKNRKSILSNLPKNVQTGNIKNPMSISTLKNIAVNDYLMQRKRTTGKGYRKRKGQLVIKNRSKKLRNKQ